MYLLPKPSKLYKFHHGHYQMQSIYLAKRFVCTRKHRCCIPKALRNICVCSGSHDKAECGPTCGSPQVNRKLTSGVRGKNHFPDQSRTLTFWSLEWKGMEMRASERIVNGSKSIPPLELYQVPRLRASGHCTNFLIKFAWNIRQGDPAS